MDSHLPDTGSPWASLPTAWLSPEAAQGISRAAKAGTQRIHRGRPRAATPDARSAALRAAWVSHTLKQAIAAVRSASDEDYRAFGWDRGELLAKLQWLRGEIEQPDWNRRTPPAVTVSLAGAPKRPAAKTSNDSKP